MQGYSDAVAIAVEVPVAIHAIVLVVEVDHTAHAVARSLLMHCPFFSVEAVFYGSALPS